MGSNWKCLPASGGEYAELPLTPTELHSVLQLLALLHEQGALPDPLVIPDEAAVLRSTTVCFFNARPCPWRPMGLKYCTLEEKELLRL